MSWTPRRKNKMAISELLRQEAHPWDQTLLPQEDTLITIFFSGNSDVWLGWGSFPCPSAGWWAPPCTSQNVQCKNSPLNILNNSATPCKGHPACGYTLSHPSPFRAFQLHRLRAEEEVTALIQTQLDLRATKNDKMGQGVKLQTHCASKTHSPDFKIR